MDLAPPPSPGCSPPAASGATADHYGASADLDHRTDEFGVQG